MSKTLEYEIDQSLKYLSKCNLITSTDDRFTAVCNEDRFRAALKRSPVLDKEEVDSIEHPDWAYMAWNDYKLANIADGIEFLIEHMQGWIHMGSCEKFNEAVEFLNKPMPDNDPDALCEYVSTILDLLLINVGPHPSEPDKPTRYMFEIILKMIDVNAKGYAVSEGHRSNDFDTACRDLRTASVFIIRTCLETFKGIDYRVKESDAFVQDIPEFYGHIGGFPKFTSGPVVEPMD